MPKTKTFPSTAIPGAAFTLVSPVTGRIRNNVELNLAGAYYRQRTARYDYMMLPMLSDGKGLDLPKMSKEDRAEAARLEGEFSASNREILLGWGKELFVSADIPGEEPIESFDKLLDQPDSFCDEVLAKAEALCGLSPDEAKNSQPPSTSRAVEGGEITDTTAIPASATSTT